MRILPLAARPGNARVCSSVLPSSATRIVNNPPSVDHLDGPSNDRGVVLVVCIESTMVWGRAGLEAGAHCKTDLATLVLIVLRDKLGLIVA